MTVKEKFVTDKFSIAIVLPTCNRPDGLNRALMSLLKQEILPDQVIVIDDGDESNASETIHPILFEKLNLSLLVTGGRKGANFARNMGVRHTDATFVSFLDDDDVFCFNKIKILKETIQENLNADLIYHTAKVYMPQQNVMYTTSTVSLNEKDDPFKVLLMGNVIGGASMVTVNRLACIDVGGFDESLPALQDIDLWIRFALHKKQFCCIQMPLTEYEQNTGSKKSTTRKVDAIILARNIIDLKYRDIYDRSMMRTISRKRYRTDIVRHMLNNNILKAVITSMKGCLLFVSPTLALMGIMAICGQNVFFKLRSKLQ